MLQRKDQVGCVQLPEQAAKAQKDCQEMREQMQPCRKLEGMGFKPGSGEKKLSSTIRLQAQQEGVAASCDCKKSF